MRRIMNECCGCAVPAYPCRGDACELRHVEHLYCDNCEHEEEILFVYEGEELCADCVLQRLPKIVFM